MAGNCGPGESVQLKQRKKLKRHRYNHQNDLKTLNSSFEGYNFVNVYFVRAKRDIMEIIILLEVIKILTHRIFIVYASKF